jgi:hypothetical protein
MRNAKIFVLENLQERHPLGKTERRMDREYEVERFVPELTGTCSGL